MYFIVKEVKASEVTEGAMIYLKDEERYVLVDTPQTVDNEVILGKDLAFAPDEKVLVVRNIFLPVIKILE